MGHIQPCPHTLVNVLKVIVYLSGIWTSCILFNPDLVDNLGWWSEGIIAIYIFIGSIIVFMLSRIKQDNSNAGFPPGNKE